MSWAALNDDRTLYARLDHDDVVTSSSFDFKAIQLEYFDQGGVVNGGYLSLGHRLPRNS